MDTGTLVKSQIDAGARFLGEFQKFAPIQAAFWLKDCEDSEPWLYVASEQITDDNIDVGYEEVGRIADALYNPWFDLMRVKLIRVDNPLMKAAADLQRHYSRGAPIHLRDKQFGRFCADEVYVYPEPVQETVQS